MSLLVEIKFYDNNSFLYILVEIKSITSGNTAKKQKNVKAGFADS